MTQEHSKVAYQVMWNRLISVVEEQAQALVRTAFSTSVREAGDLSAGVYDTHGNMLAQAVTGTPGHVNAMADAVARARILRFIGSLLFLSRFASAAFVSWPLNTTNRSEPR